MIYGGAVTLGVLLGEILSQKFSNIKSMFICMVCINVINLILKLELSTVIFYTMYIAEILLVGAILPLLLNI